MRHLALSLALALSPALLFSAPASAQTTAGATESGQNAPDTVSTQTTIEGRALGEHVSGHAPEHPLEQGQLFGDCVAELAISGTCPHEDVDGLDG
jgi:hypothetical protein